MFLGLSEGVPQGLWGAGEGKGFAGSGSDSRIPDGPARQQSDEWGTKHLKAGQKLFSINYEDEKNICICSCRSFKHLCDNEASPIVSK